MKKSIIAIVMLLMAVGMMQAVTPDQLKGKWQSGAVTESATPDMPMDITTKYAVAFTADGKVDMTSDATFAMDIMEGVHLDMFMQVKCSGTYTCQGDDINISYDPKSVKINFSEDDLRIRGIDDPQQANTIKKQIYGMFGPMVQEMAKQFEESEVWHCTSIEGSKMTCVVDETTYNFKKK